MKKLVVISALLLSPLLWRGVGGEVFAQLNGGFENWTNTGSYDRPDNWQTLNFLSLFSPPNPLSAFKATGVDKHSGTYALKLKTIYLNNNPAPQTLPDTIGYVFTGKIIISPPSLKFGIPYTGRPEKLEFWSKYIPVGDDAAGVVVVLQKWNGTSADTIAYGEKIIDTTITYTYFQIDLTYQSAVSPDTIVIGFASSYKRSKARVGSTLYIDDVALTGWVGIDEQNIYTDKVKVFPNPAKENVTILAQIEEADNVQVLDASGKLAGIYKIQNYKTNVNTGVFAASIYFYEIYDKNNRVLSKGKFNVVK